AQRDAQRVTNAVDKPRRNQRMPAQSKEIVVDTNVLNPEDLCKQFAEFLFLRISGSPIFFPLALGFGQSLRVQLSIPMLIYVSKIFGLSIPAVASQIAGTV